MVACDGAVVARTVVSLMMNGMCCARQMQEEEDRSVETLSDVRTDHARERLVEKKLRKARSVMEESPHPYDAWLQEERRRLLISTKLKVNAKTAHTVQDEEYDCQKRSTTDNNSTKNRRLPLHCPARTVTAQTQPFQKMSMQGTLKNAYEPQPRFSGEVSSQSRHNVSDRSLLDDEEDEDEKSSLVDVALQ